MDKRVVENAELLASASETLSRTPKSLDSKWFYDAAGSALFEEITALPEYYPTRTEVGILSGHAQDLSQYIPTGAALVEIGSGASVKTRLLLDRMPQLSVYVPLDISAAFLREVGNKLQQDYPSLEVVPVVADFMAELSLPPVLEDRELVAFFPGSTIGNLTPDEAIDLLARIRGMGRVRALILGADLVKDPDVLVAAYDDAAGITAAFNLNLLHRLNREVGATFDVEAFDHEARWNSDESRIEMHLVSRKDQHVDIGLEQFEFTAGESIHTENSHKYTKDKIAAMGDAAGWHLDTWMTDPDRAFSVSVLTA